MKKALACILILFVIVPACGESVDFSGMDNESLTALYESARNEMIARGLLKEMTLPAGAYYAGSFLPEGTYIITLQSGGCYVKTFASYQAYLNGEECISKSWMIEGDSFIMILTGETCYFVEEQMTVSPAGAVW